MTEFLEPLYWLQSHEWSFWILVNLSAYLTYWLCRYNAIGILGVLFPFASGACTVIVASEWWMGSIGIATILVVVAPFLVFTWRNQGKAKGTG